MTDMYFPTTIFFNKKKSTQTNKTNHNIKQAKSTTNKLLHINSINVSNSLLRLSKNALKLIS